MQAHLALTVGVLLFISAAAARAYDKDHPANFDPSRYADRAAWEKRAEFLRMQSLVAQGLWPMPEKTPLAPVVHGKIERDGYTVERVFFASMPGHYVTGSLYRPTGRDGKRPAVLMPYGHWPDGRVIWRDDAGVKKDIDGGAEKDPVAARSPLQANCVQLARMGCVVFHWDLVGYGDSTAIPHREGFTDAEAVMRLQSQMGLQTWNGVRAMDFVTSLPDVDATRVAVAGSSGGGTQSIALSVVDKQRVAASFPMVMVSMNMQGGCVCENAPLWRVNTNNVELASLFAPKPEGMAAANDWTHDFMTRGLPEMKAIWKLYGAEGDVDGEHFDFGHNHNLHSRLLQYRFLNKHLKLDQSEPIEEKLFEPVPPEQLHVFDEQHPKPTEFADAATLRRTMTAASDEQLAKLSEADYVKTVRAALGAMIADEGRDVTRTAHHSSMPKKWDRVIIWWDTKFVVPANANPMHDYAVYGPVQFVTDAATQPAAASKPADPKFAYAGFTLGYNRSPLGQQVCDLLDLIAHIRQSERLGGQKVKSISLVGTGDGALAALIARAVAGDKIDRAVIDLGQFDFDRVKDDPDDRLLPGALKYGGVYGFAPLCDSGDTLIVNAPPAKGATRKSEHVRIETEPRDQEQIAAWIAKGHR
jgi:hypothetical protein